MFCLVVAPGCTNIQLVSVAIHCNKCLVFAKSLFVYVQERST
jgi:hypothetical protein